MTKRSHKSYAVFPLLLSGSFSILLLAMLVSLLLTNVVLDSRRMEISKLMEADAMLVRHQTSTAGMPASEEEWQKLLTELPALPGLEQSFFVVDSTDIIAGGKSVDAGTCIQDLIPNYRPGAVSSGDLTKDGTEYFFCIYPVSENGQALGGLCSQQMLLAAYTAFLSEVVSVALLLFAVSFLACIFFGVLPMKNLISEHDSLKVESEKRDLLLVEAYLRDLILAREELIDLPGFLLDKNLPIDFDAAFYPLFLRPDWSPVPMPPYREVTAAFDNLSGGFAQRLAVILQQEQGIVYLLQSEYSCAELSKNLMQIQPQLKMQFSRPIAMLFCDRSIYIEELRSVFQRLQQMVPMRMFYGMGCFLLMSQDLPEYHHSLTEPERADLQERIDGYMRSMLREHIDIYDDLLALLNEQKGCWPAYEEALLLVRTGLDQVLLQTGGDTGARTAAADLGRCREITEVGMRLREILDTLHQRMEDVPVRRQMEYTEQIAAIIQAHAQEQDFSIQQIADSVGLSAAYLSRIYRQGTGRSIAGDIAALRMEMAVRLLSDGDMPIGEIYAHVGYTTNNYFYRVFRKSFGITPKAYRELSEEARRTLVMKSGEEGQL